MPKQISETDEIIRLAAEEAMRYQQIIREARPFEEFMDSGKMAWLKKEVFSEIEKEIMTMIRSLEFVPNSIAQLAHVKGQMEVLDRIENRILGRIQEAKDARHKLDEIENSTPQEG